LVSAHFQEISMTRVEHIGDATLYLGDCEELLPSIGSFDACVMDPPYGIGVDRAMAKVSGTQYGNAAAPKSNYIASGWDDFTPSKSLLDAIIKTSKYQIIFGGNYFDLPPTRCYLVWDKANGSNAFADCELAWTNLDKPVRRIEWMWNGMLRRDGEARNGHPTQKPLEVMRWCIEQLPQGCETILDPFAGSGTTGVAAIMLGKRFVGIERHPEYFDIMCKRLEAARKQPDMFISPPTKPIQEALL
jgi:DNA modification methylase